MSNKKVIDEKAAIDPHVDVNPDDLEGLMNDMLHVIDRFNTYFDAVELTNTERRRLLGSGIRRYGFIDKVSDLAETFPQYNPAMFDLAALKEKLRDIEFLRNLLALSNELARQISNCIMVESNESFRMALEYYNSVRRLALAGDAGAIAVFNMLEPFFRRTRRAGEQPTEHELERDVHALLHGKKDGRIVIENERPHMTGGKHAVIDQTHKPEGEWKVTESGDL